MVTGGSDYHGDAGTRARMGRLPCGWRTLERDIAALMAAVDLAAPIDHLQKGAAGCITRDTVPSRGRQERLLRCARQLVCACARPGSARPAAEAARLPAAAGPSAAPDARTPAEGQEPRKAQPQVAASVKVPWLVLILLAGAGVYGYIWKIQSDVRPYLNVFLDNVSVDGIDLSGLTWAEGSQLVWDHVNQKQNGWYVTPAQRQRTVQGHYRPDAGHLFLIPRQR